MVDLKAVIAQMAADIKEMKEDRRSLMMELASTKSMMSQRDNEINALRNKNTQLERRLSLFKAASTNAAFTPPPNHHLRQSHTGTPHTTATASHAHTSTTNTESSLAADSTEHQSPPLLVTKPREGMPLDSDSDDSTSKVLRVPDLKYGHDAQVASESKSSDGNGNNGGNKGVRV